jgi:diadenosine tetraphosphate (Ap4A) HIT family hydrolase
MNGNNTCPFCNLVRGKLIETELSFAIYDGYPVSEGHVLIVPKRHTANYFDLTNEEQTDCFSLLNKAKKIIQDKCNPDGFNVGINVNESAGQTVPHAHIHLIPRNNGDVEEPRGGVRGVIPSKRSY